jgi:antitoxin component YwqK of YwqJK toxin-antitoxin module
MKKILFILMFLTILIGCSSEKMNFSQLQNRNGIFFPINSDKPFSGDIISYSNGMVEFIGKINKGLRDATWTYYYPSGQKKMIGSFKEGLKEGTWTYWNDNGTQAGMEVYKYGKLLSNQGTIPQDFKTDSTTTATEQATPKKVEKKEHPVSWDQLHGGPVKDLNGAPYTGPVVKYQTNGVRDFYGYLTDGKKSGKWTYYTPRGDIRDVKYY